MVATYDEYKPKKEQLLVGDEHILEVRELVASKRDQVFNVVFGEVNVVGAISAITQLADDETKNEATSELAKTAQKILGGSLTQIAQIVLDTKANRKKVNLESEKFDDWLADNMTMKQEARLLELVIEVNDFVGLVKNYVALVGKVQPTGEASPEKEETQPDQTSQ
jgi:hypothetical protein